jgi:antitoxin ParD1/3/4
MPTRNVSLTDHWDQFVIDLVESGEYNNASEVHRDALRLLEQRRADHAAKCEALRNALAVADDDYAAGRYVEVPRDEIPSFVARLKKRSLPVTGQ